MLSPRAVPSKGKCSAEENALFQSLLVGSLVGDSDLRILSTPKCFGAKCLQSAELCGLDKPMKKSTFNQKFHSQTNPWEKNPGRRMTEKRTE
jgi:hypothetical protein